MAKRLDASFWNSALPVSVLESVTLALFRYRQRSRQQCGSDNRKMPESYGSLEKKKLVSGGRVASRKLANGESV